MSEFCAHRPKTYAFLIDGINDYEKHGIINKKAKGTKKSVIQNQITFNDYVNVLFNKTKLIKSQFSFRSTTHDIDTEKVNKISLSSNDNKRIQCSDNINTYPYGYNAKDVIDYNNLIDKVHMANNRCNNVSKDTDTLLEDVDVLLNRMNKLKDKSKKRMEHSNKLLEEYEVINDKIDKTIEKSKIETCEFNMLIESTNELVKRTNNNCEKTVILLDNIKKLNTKVDKLKKRSKKGINKSKELLKSYEINNDNANTLIKRLKTINKDGNLNKRGVG